MDGMKTGKTGCGVVGGPPAFGRTWGFFNREITRKDAKFEGMKQPGKFMRGNPSAFQISRPFAFFRGSLFDAKFGGQPD
jgi:hypothetical protein